MGQQHNFLLVSFAFACDINFQSAPVIPITMQIKSYHSLPYNTENGK